MGKNSNHHTFCLLAFLYQQKMFFFIYKYKNQNFKFAEYLHTFSFSWTKFYRPHIMKLSILNITAKFHGSIHSILGGRNI
jgi:hypothetical protein